MLQRRCVLIARPSSTHGTMAPSARMRMTRGRLCAERHQDQRKEGQMKLRSSYKGPALAAVSATAVMFVITAYVGSAKGDDETSGRDSDAYTIGLFGDMPYNALGRAQYPALLADINRHHVAFSVFDGDLKSGGDGPCADRLYYTPIENFNKLYCPLISVPGVNDWS